MERLLAERRLEVDHPGVRRPEEREERCFGQAGWVVVEQRLVGHLQPELVVSAVERRAVQLQVGLEASEEQQADPELASIEERRVVPEQASAEDGHQALAGELHPVVQAAVRGQAVWLPSVKLAWQCQLLEHMWSKAW